MTRLKLHSTNLILHLQKTAHAMLQRRRTPASQEREKKCCRLAYISPDEVLETTIHVRTLQQSTCDSTAGTEGPREKGFVAQAMLAPVEVLV